MKRSIYSSGGIGMINPKKIFKTMADGGAALPDVGDPLIPSGGTFSEGTKLGNKAADIGSRLAYGQMTGLANMALAPGNALQSKEPITTEEMVAPATSIAMSAMGNAGVRPTPGTSGVFVGPYGAHMLRDADRSLTKPHPVYGEEAKQAAERLRPEFRDIYKATQADLRDAGARGILEMRQGSLNPKTDRDIFPASGWSYGAEGAIRKEIPDIGAKLVPAPGSKDTFLLEHPAGDLHKLYDVPPIKFDQTLPKNMKGYFEPDTNQIVISGTPNQKNLKSAVSTVLHEFQHAIQKKEGFARGANPDQLLSKSETLALKAGPTGSSTIPSRNAFDEEYFGPGSPSPSHHDKMRNTIISRGGDPDSLEARIAMAKHEAYKRSAGEVEARNVEARRAKSYRYNLHPEDTEDITRGLQHVDVSNMPRTYEKADGGGISQQPPWFVRNEARGMTGMLKSAIPGRTDKIPLNVAGGSYVLPADIPSALGQGNTMAGGNILDKMFNRGPYGMNLPRAKAGSSTKMARMSSLSKTRKSGYAEGGDTGVAPIIAAGGEYILSPDQVADIGGGDMNSGHKILDAFVNQVRAQHINTLKGLKPPKRD